MKKIVTTFILCLMGLSLIGCSNMSKQDVGTVTGGVIGGLVGSQFGGGGGRILAIGAGTMLGAVLGNQIGKNMDDTDRLRMNQALENNAAGQPAYWTNSRSGASYRVVPTKNVSVGSNKYCREFRSTADIAGKTQQIYGTACRQPDGTWKQVSSR